MALLALPTASQAQRQRIGRRGGREVPHTIAIDGRISRNHCDRSAGNLPATRHVPPRGRIRYRAFARLARRLSGARPFLESLPVWGTAQPEPEDPIHLKKDLGDLKKEFEDQQKQLRREIDDSLEKIAQTNDAYNKEWNAGMQDLNDIRNTFRPLMKDLKDLWTAHSDREWAKPLAAWADEALQDSLMAIDAAHAGMKLAGSLGADAGS